MICSHWNMVGSARLSDCLPAKSSLGSLNMYLGKESYERAGLVGKTYGAKGNRKLKPRWGRFESSSYTSIS